MARTEQQLVGTPSSPTAWAGRPYREIREIGKRDGSILLVPVGSIEQHGHHLPVVTDSLIVNSVAHGGAERIHEEIPALVTPPIWSGYSPQHLPFGGTISLELQSLLAVIEDVCETSLQNGFDALVLLNGHGGNKTIVESAVDTIGIPRDEVEVLGLTYFQLARDFIDEVRDSEMGGMSHGGEFETSLVMHLAPELVDTDNMERKTKQPHYSLSNSDMFERGPLTTNRKTSERTSSGVRGHPEHATAEKGEAIFEGVCDELAALLREVHNAL